MSSSLYRAASFCIGALYCLTGSPAVAQQADSASPVAAEVENLRERLDAQQKEIDALREQLDETGERLAEREQKIKKLDTDPPPARSRLLDRIWISGEGAIGLYHTGSEGQFPNAEFRPDDVRLRVEAHVWDTVFAVTELNVVTREDRDEFLLGEMFIDFENVSGKWGRDNLLTIRVGRFYTPFGEEYQFRTPAANPLITHSLSDVWGVDEGIEAFGRFGRFHYAIAVQNGGHAVIRDFHADKAVIGRVGYQFQPWLSGSFSAMRTGKLDALEEREGISEIWFGDGFIAPVGDRTLLDIPSRAARA